MKLIVIDKQLVILDITDSGGARALNLHVDRVPEHTEVCLTRSSDGKYAIAEIRNGVARFDKAFISNEDDTYSITLKSPDGQQVTAWFDVREGVIARKMRGTATEVKRLWQAIAYLVEVIEKQNETMTDFMDGYITE